MREHARQDFSILNMVRLKETQVLTVASLFRVA